METMGARPEPIALCARCAREAPESATWCPRCGAPRSIIATAGLFESEITTWVGLGGGLAASRPRGVIVLGLWLLLLPDAAWGLTAAWITVHETPFGIPQAVASVVFLVVGAGLLALLARSALRYARARTSTPPEVPSAVGPSSGGNPPSDQPLAR